MRSKLLAWVIFTLAWQVNPVSAQAAYPSKPIKVVVGFAPGGAADYVARTVGEHLSRALGQPIVI